jgi:prophage regulatory protein
MIQHNSLVALRLPDVKRRTGLSRGTVYRLMLQGRFPRPHKLSDRLSAWNEADIDSWLASKMAGGVK